MAIRKPTARASEAAGAGSVRSSRREFLAGGLVLAALPLLPRGVLAEAALPETTRALLTTSPFVYVSPLRSDRSESTCHGEVWYGWQDGAVHLVTSRTSWKARSLERGLDRARIWVGDHGRWKRGPFMNEAFREAPHFEARARRVPHAGAIDPLMERYRVKYPDEIGTWEPRFRSGLASGERVLLRYDPLVEEATPRS